MYNRYIPQPDGSYRKSRHPDSENQPKPPSTRPAEEVQCPEPPHQSSEPPKQSTKSPPSAHIRSSRPSRPAPQKIEKQEPFGLNIGSFLRQLLPKDFDTGDLIVILLLLLMSSDCQEEQNTALLTLALYLFL